MICKKCAKRGDKGGCGKDCGNGCDCQHKGTKRATVLHPSP